MWRLFPQLSQKNAAKLTIKKPSVTTNTSPNTNTNTTTSPIPRSPPASPLPAIPLISPISTTTHTINITTANTVYGEDKMTLFTTGMSIDTEMSPSSQPSSYDHQQQHQQQQHEQHSDAPNSGNSNPDAINSFHQELIACVLHEKQQHQEEVIYVESCKSVALQRRSVDVTVKEEAEAGIAAAEEQRGCWMSDCGSPNTVAAVDGYTAGCCLNPAVTPSPDPLFQPTASTAATSVAATTASNINKAFSPSKFHTFFPLQPPPTVPPPPALAHQTAGYSPSSPSSSSFSQQQHQRHQQQQRQQCDIIPTEEQHIISLFNQIKTLRNTTTAIKQLRTLASPAPEDGRGHGHRMAQFYMGVCYNQGYGVSAIDPVTAVQWFTSAAEQGDSKAQFNLVSKMLPCSQ